MPSEGFEILKDLPVKTLLLLEFDSEDLKPSFSELISPALRVTLTDEDRAAMERGDIPTSLSSRCYPAASNDPWGAIVLLGYRLHFLPLAFFNLVYDCLAPAGLLILSIKQDQSIEEKEKQTLHQKRDYISRLAQRCGLEGLSKKSEIAGNATTLIFRKSARAPRWRLDQIKDADLVQFTALFKEAFNNEIDPALWRWKYAEGRGHGIIARREGRLIAHYGCTRRRALYFGRPITALQMCDVMVDPRERGVMTKQGAMFLTTATMLELYLGLQPADLPYGFPNGRHERLGERLGLYAEVGRIMELRWPALEDRPRLRTRIHHLRREDTELNQRLVNTLWQAMSQDLQEAIVVIRDWDYLVYRYLDHPVNRYEILVVKERFTGRPLGLMVLRQLDSSIEILDLIAPLRHIRLLVDQARRLAGRWKADSVFCWITTSYLKHFATNDMSVKDPDISIPTNVWVDGPSPEQIKDRWWLMSGDTDFH